MKTNDIAVNRALLMSIIAGLMSSGIWTRESFTKHLKQLGEQGIDGCDDAIDIVESIIVTPSSSGQ